MQKIQTVHEINEHPIDEIQTTCTMAFKLDITYNQYNLNCVYTFRLKPMTSTLHIKHYISFQNGYVG